jgi:hypothetical protein
MLPPVMGHTALCQRWERSNAHAIQPVDLASRAPVGGSKREDIPQTRTGPLLQCAHVQPSVGGCIGAVTAA